MEFKKTPLAGVMRIFQQPHADERGSFSRVFCQKEFQENNLPSTFLQSNLCENRGIGTLRGLHIQKQGAEEAKLVLCTRGRIFDVCVDVRPDSPTWGQYVSAELSCENGQMLFLPAGCAHGYITLEPDCQLLYFMSAFYQPNSAYGFRYDDPAFSIDWPRAPSILSEQDAHWPYVHKFKSVEAHDAYNNL